MSTEIPPVGRESGAAARLQILATEHWSLLATRALTYNEALSRVTIFLAILSGALIALALVAQADHFGAIFISIAIPLLALVVFALVLIVVWNRRSIRRVTPSLEPKIPSPRGG